MTHDLRLCIPPVSNHQLEEGWLPEDLKVEENSGAEFGLIEASINDGE